MGKYFSISELCESKKADELGIDNTPGIIETANMENLIDNVLDPTREYMGRPVSVSSGYRCIELNFEVKGARRSQHLTGEAADITCRDRSLNEKMFLYIKGNLVFDQLINERDYQWIHVSFKADGENRMEALSSPSPGVYLNC